MAKESTLGFSNVPSMIPPLQRNTQSPLLFVSEVHKKPIVTNMLKQWWNWRMTRTQVMALVALFAVFTVVGINVLYLPVHVLSEHHGLVAASVHDHESRHHDNARQDKRPEHEDADHDLPSSRPLASVVAPVSLSLAVIFILPPPCLVTQAIETHWYPTCIDSDRAPPGPSRAPPV